MQPGFIVAALLLKNVRSEVLVIWLLIMASWTSGDGFLLSIITAPAVVGMRMTSRSVGGISAAWVVGPAASGRRLWLTRSGFAAGGSHVPLCCLLLPA